MLQDQNRNILFTSLAQFGMAFSGNFISVFMPFYILSVTPYSQEKTLIWIGLIMGANNIISAFASYLWGFSTSRFSPKSLYLRGLLAHTVLYFAVGFTSNLHVLLFLRLLQGVFGGISTIGLVIISATSSRERISADIGLFQTFFTLGTLIGPPVGALAASTLGYQAAFVTSSAFLLAVSIFFQLCATEIPLQPKKEKFFDRSAINRNTFLGWMLGFTAMVQLMFLPSILPNVFENFQIDKTAALRWAGIVTMFTTATATLGTYFWTRLSVKVGKEQMVITLLVFGSLSQALLALSHGVLTLTVIRMVQTGLMAAILPLVISIFAADLKGGAIGFLNSARYVGNALGPIIATSIMAYSSFTVLCLSISAMTLLALLSFKIFFRGGNDPVEG